MRRRGGTGCFDDAEPPIEFPEASTKKRKKGDGEEAAVAADEIEGAGRRDDGGIPARVAA